jgi:hypothetical protein
MLDLETLGTDPATAPIIQIGAVGFELGGDGPMAGVPLFSELVSARSCLEPPFCRTLDPDTIVWWAETDPELLVKIMRGQGVSLSNGIASLGIWFARYDDDGIEGVWSNGATFDIPMLEAAYKQEGYRIPWHFRTVRDVRTMAMIAGDDPRCWNGGTVTETEARGQKHDALVDCLRQVRMVQQVWALKVRHDAT